MENKKCSELSKKICLKIKFERLKKNFSQEDLAFKANLSRASIGKIERGEVSPTLETLEKIALALDIDSCELFNVTKIDL